MKFIKRLRYSSSGVTLIELILVMGILAVGTAVAVPQMKAANTKKTMATATRSLGMVADALRIYHSDYEPPPLAGFNKSDWPLLNSGLPAYAGVQDDTGGSILNILQGKGFLKITDLYQSGECYQFFWPSTLSYKMAIYPKNSNGTCNLTSPDYYWYSMQLSVGRSNDEKGMGTAYTIKRNEKPDQF